MSNKPDVWEADDIVGLAQAVDGFSPEHYVDVQAEQAAGQVAVRRTFLAGVGSAMPAAEPEPDA